MSYLGPDVHWFPVGQSKRRQARITSFFLGGFFGFVAFSCLIYGAVGGGVSPAWRVPFLVVGALCGIGAVLLVRRILSKAGAGDAALGIDPNGVWWHESGTTTGFTWQELAGVRMHRIQRVSGRAKHFTCHLELIPHHPHRTGDPRRDRFLVNNRYWIDLPDALMVSGLIRIAEGTADLVSGSICAVRPDLWRGLVHTPNRWDV